MLEGGNNTCKKKTNTEAAEMLAKEVKKGLSMRATSQKVAEETGLNPNSIRTLYYHDRYKEKNPQITAWGKAEGMLSKTIKYMMENCETPADIDSKVIVEFEDLLRGFLSPIMLPVFFVASFTPPDPAYPAQFLNNTPPAILIALS